MTTIALTAETAAGDLLTELRDLLQRHDGAATLDEARAIADEVTTVLRRARGRIAHLGRKTTEQTKPVEVKPAPEPVAPKPVEVKRVASTPVQAATRPAVEPQPDRTPAALKPAASPEHARVRPAARHVTRLHVALAVIAIAWSTVRTGIARGVRRITAALGSAARRTGTRFAADPPGRLDEAANHPEECIVCGPGCCSPVLGVHASNPGPLVGRTVASVR